MIYDFEFTGQMPLLMHRDNIEGQDEVTAWQNSEHGKKVSKKGDDRSPAWLWHTYLYTDGQHITMPADNIMSALRFGGQKVTVGDTRKTFKELSQSGLFLVEEHYPLLVGGKPIPIAKIEAIRELPFPEQAEKVKKLGFALFMKRATIGKAKHIRVRPRFDEWAIRGQIQVLDPVITGESLAKILDATGRLAGFGDWRPGAEYPRKPGPFGTFTVTQLKPAK